MRRALFSLCGACLAAYQLAEEGQTSKFTAGHQFASAVVWSQKDVFLLVAERPAGQIRRIDSKGTTMWREGFAVSGLAIDEKNVVYATDARERRVVRIDNKGKLDVLASSFEGKRFNGP